MRATSGSIDTMLEPMPPTAPRAKRLLQTATVIGWLCAMAVAVKKAYTIRLHAIHTYGYVIHEFDPWFNYRATEYLAANGLRKFFTWFDRMAWYPLGRPVGSTIYPGMQLSSVALWKAMGYLHSLGLMGWYAGFAPKGTRTDFSSAVKGPISLNDVCCLVPAWFGALATIFLGLLTLETTNSYSASAFAALCMSTVPAHLMRSVGGGYDNESIALTVMCATFYLWCRSLRGDRCSRHTYIYGFLAGLAYAYMVAAWGGFTFVVNAVGCHAFCLAVLGRYTEKLRVAYSLFYVVGTIGAVLVPVVGWRPLKDMELLPPFLVFVGLQVQARAVKYAKARELNFVKSLGVLAAHGVVLVAVLSMVAFVLYPQGYFGPPSSRVRGLFVKHTRTGNPLVDSVAEHQPTSKQAYQQYLSTAIHLVPYGLGLSLLRVSDATPLLWIYFGIAYHFASKMARLMILAGPIASALVGVALGAAFDHGVLFSVQALVARGCPAPVAEKPKRKGKPPAEKLPVRARRFVAKTYRHPVSCLLRIGLALYFALYTIKPQYTDFLDYCEELAEGLSQPSIMFKAKLRDGQEIMVDDYREAYWWLRDHTPKDARILAWWDYGYQITGIGERTTLADGNTWNHEHIATLGYILTSPEDQAHKIAKHLADYVLVWAGGGGDDLAKSPHMARIGNSIYHHFCPDDPTCQHFGFYPGGQPTPSMEASLLYKLTTHDPRRPSLNTSRWEPVYQSKYGKVRIFKIKKVSKKSRTWVKEHTLCDAPGSWYCPGQYPPAVQWLIDLRKPFRQLEDFNKKADSEADEYTKKYHEKMSAREGGPGEGREVAAAALKYVGCFRLESELPEQRVYGGGVAGASASAALQHARQHKKRYVAIARAANDGHAFAFDALPSGVAVSDGGCARPCADDDAFACGCADAGCDGVVTRGADEEYVRRWAVYDASAPKRRKRKARAEL